jgi:hypothetical protein
MIKMINMTKKLRFSCHTTYRPSGTKKEVYACFLPTYCPSRDNRWPVENVQPEVKEVREVKEVKEVKDRNNRRSVENVPSERILPLFLAQDRY